MPQAYTSSLHQPEIQRKETPTVRNDYSTKPSLYHTERWPISTVAYAPCGWLSVVLFVAVAVGAASEDGVVTV
jgi:hypothetical protein